MSEYRRFISYIYAYENGQKTTNKGFAKIEMRGEMTTIELHIRGAGLSAPTAGFYLYVGTGEQITGIKLGDVPFNNGCTDWRFTLNQANLSDTPYSISDVNGILLNLDKTIVYVSQWDEQPVNYDSFRPYIHENNDDLDRLEDKEQEDISNSVSEKKSIQTAELSASPQSEQIVAFVPIPPSYNDDPKDQDHSEITSAWQEFYNSHEKIFPFFDEGISCIKIELKDLRKLPASNWQLANNSFLLRGFFTYHHLIIGNLPSAKNKNWFVGVPGIQYRQEHVMAAIFGFTEFIPDKESTEAQAPFGYWILPISVNPTDESD